MNGDLARVPAAKSRRIALSFTSIAVWLAATVLAAPLGMWTAIGGAAVILGVAVLLFDHPSSAALLRPSVRLVAVGLAAGCAMVAGTYLAYPVVARNLAFVARDTAQLYAAFRAPPPIVVGLLLVPIIAGEELVWRGVVQTPLVERAGALRGVALAAVVYALVHAPLGSPVLAAVAFFCGLSWGALRAATASLVPSLVAHLLWTALVLVFLPLAPR